MGIRKKMLILLMTTLTTILILSYIFIYSLYSRTTTSHIISHQELAISLNTNLTTSFVNSIKQMSLLLISDEAIGKSLSSQSTDTFSLLKSRSTIQKQFSHYLTAQIYTPGQYYRNVLFLNDTLPLSEMLEAKTLSNNPYAASSNVFSNRNVKNEYWYVNALVSPGVPYAFINQETKDLCFSQRIQNSYFTGTYSQGGLGVMVTSIKLSTIEDIFSFTAITPNSGYVMMNNQNEILLSNNPNISSELLDSIVSQISAKNFNYQQGKSSVIYNNSQKYLINTNIINYGIRLIFLTPYSDIQSDVLKTTMPFIIFSLIILLIFILVILSIATHISDPIIRLSTAIGNIEDTRTFDAASLDNIKGTEMVILCNSFKSLIDKTNTLIDDVHRQSEEQKIYELRTLQAQINPHFLFNTMDVINWLALSRGDDDIANVVDSVANMMRYSITNPDGVVNRSPSSRQRNKIRFFCS